MLVKSLRQKSNWSQEQLAQLSGLNIRTIQRVEKGEGVGFETFKYLTAVFEVDVNELKNENRKENEVHDTQVNKSPLVGLEKREQIAKVEVQSQKEFYLLALVLIGSFIFICLPNYNQGENLEPLIVMAISYVVIIGVNANEVFQPFGDKWEKKNIRQAMERYKEESEI